MKLAAKTKDPSLKGSSKRTSADVNRLEEKDRPFHDWYRFVLSYPPHLVRDYLSRFQLGSGATVLDPFCGTGTTVVESKKCGISSVGIEAHPMSHFASRTKVDWAIDAESLGRCAGKIADEVLDELESIGVQDDPQGALLCEEISPKLLKTLSPEQTKLILKDSISPLPLHKVLVLRDVIERRGKDHASLLRLALARELVSSIGNLHFGPEVGVGKLKQDAPVVSSWLSRVLSYGDDLRAAKGNHRVDARVIHGDSRSECGRLPKASVDAVITSPPYPNEKDYTRTTRLESVLLGFIQSKEELRAVKQGKLMRSNTRNIYKGDDDDAFVADNRRIQKIAAEIEARRVELGKTSGFERLYPKVTLMYFGGMARHLAELRQALKPGARLAYVVGDQASFLRVMIRTGQILAELAEKAGYEVEGIDLFRTRLATATKEQLREEVVILRWPG